MKVIMTIFVLILLLSCEQTDNQTIVSPEQMRTNSLQNCADSLENYADSLAQLRKIHSMFSGRHIHAPGSDLAQAAHQNIPGKRRMRRNANSQRESRQRAAAFHAERVKTALKE